ncbi:zinc ribbon domain-containing protein [Secundilactobacillus oryzae]|uniref:zinc ribbon domain-containing protein n=1 Tax=Secundilactobacillus oryzae TaxID=1202668 RepID=UPI00068D22C9|nr:zinc ribbon domain-containing protein [Secundilactobacillus oryzae]
MENETKFCIKCGKEIPAVAEFCSFCGAKQNYTKSEATVNGNESSDLNEADSKASTSSGETSSTVQSASTQTTPVKESENDSPAGIIFFGWACALVALFIPIIGLGGIGFSIALINGSKAKSAGILLLIFSIIFMWLGFTGFGAGFMNGVRGS